MSQLITDLKKASAEGRIVLMGEGSIKHIDQILDYLQEHPTALLNISHDDSIMSSSYMLLSREIGDKHEKDNK